MNRREFVRNTVAVSVAASLPLAAEVPPASRMNILYVFGDQHRACSMPGKPYSLVQAPAFEAFAKQNFVMENCISNYPLCTPHRGILMSGRWPQQTGVFRNGPDIMLQPTEHGLGQPFKEAGYRTGYVGKWHLYNGEGQFVPPGPLRFGFDYWCVYGNTNKHYDDFTWDSETGQRIDKPGWAPVPMTDQAIEFIHAQKKEQPWMMVVSWNPPHPPFNPPPEDVQSYPKDGLQLRPNVSLTLSNGNKPMAPQLQSEEILRAAEQGYYGNITGVDQQFQRLLDALDSAGMADNTIVVYTSDHGEMMGTHARMQKQVPWEESCHVPFYLRIPGARNRGQSSKNLMSSIDIYPTLCGLAGIPVPKHCAGRDVSALLRGEPAPSAEAVFVMNHSDGDVNNPTAIGYRGVRTLTHTYAVAADGRWLLYDNMADPYQEKNLIGDPAHRPLMDKFDALILAWLQKTADPFPLLELVSKQSAQPD